MIEREILVANTKTQRRYKLTTSATTLGELKAAMMENDIDYSGLDFTEGITKTQLLDDASLLPTNVPYKGSVTNNLVILLTNNKKKIDSGTEDVSLTDRAEAYRIIKEHNLQEAVKEEFGRNFTQVPTAALWAFIQGNGIDQTCCGEDNCEDDEEEYEVSDIVDNLFTLVQTLVEERVMTEDDVDDLRELLETVEYPNCKAPKANPVSSSDGKITNDDIDNMIDSLHA